LALEKLNKIIKTLEEELTSKADKLKQYDVKLSEYKSENMTLNERIKEVQKQYERFKKESS
jgi:predicted  nucleic acid-binding Zn-ribbon protein